MFRYNTEGKFEGYTTEWGEIGGGGGGLTTEAHVANNAVVTLDLTAAVDHKVTATGICTVPLVVRYRVRVRIINSGSVAVGFNTYFLFPSGNTCVNINCWSNQFICSQSTGRQQGPTTAGASPTGVRGK